MQIDATMLSTFKTCPRKFQFRFVQNLQPIGGVSVDLQFGKAFAFALEQMRKAFWEQGIEDTTDLLVVGLEKGLRCFGVQPAHKSKNARNLWNMIWKYQSIWPVQKEQVLVQDKPAIEVFKQHQIGNFTYCGTMDFVMKIGLSLFVVDEKTTTTIQTNWAYKWEMRSQLLGYVWLLMQEGLPVQGFIVRGMSTKSEFQQSQQLITRKFVQNWLCNTYSWLQKITRCLAEDFFPATYDEACTLYYGCPYKKLCQADSPEEREALQVSDFRKEVWNPATRSNQAEGEGE